MNRNRVKRLFLRYRRCHPSVSRVIMTWNEFLAGAQTNYLLQGAVAEVEKELNRECSKRKSAGAEQAVASVA